MLTWRYGDDLAEGRLLNSAYALVKMLTAFRVRSPLRHGLLDFALRTHDNDRDGRVAQTVPKHRYEHSARV